MKWIELNEKALNKLKSLERSEIPFLVGKKDESEFSEWKYDIVSYLDLSDDSLFDENDKKRCWSSLIFTIPSSISCCCINVVTEYTEEELLYNFTHYCLLDLNKDTKKG